jgi:hypothetical protein
MSGPVESIGLDPNGQTDFDVNSDDELPGAKPKRKWSGGMTWTLIKRWVTGDKALMELEDIDREFKLLVFELAQEWMTASKLKTLRGHVQKHTAVVVWKQFRKYTQNKETISIQLFRYNILFAHLSPYHVAK